MNLPSLAGLSLTALVLGARHGLDWDHLAAMTDLVGAPGQRARRSLGLAFWYCAGHGLVIILLGAMVGLVGVHLPAGIDRIFEVIVGGTLVFLGLLVLWQVWRQRGAYRYASRWRLLIDLVGRAWRRRRGAVQQEVAAALSQRAAFGIGILHGTGAETPTQVILFASAAAAGASGAVLVLLAFVVGLIASDLMVALFWISGRLGAGHLPFGQSVLGLLTGVASVAVGSTFVIEKSSILPSLVGG
ncbi:MAG: DNA repair protein [Chloroflexota bacterium]